MKETTSPQSKIPPPRHRFQHHPTQLHDYMRDGSANNEEAKLRNRTRGPPHIFRHCPTQWRGFVNSACSACFMNTTRLVTWAFVDSTYMLRHAQQNCTSRIASVVLAQRDSWDTHKCCKLVRLGQSLHVTVFRERPGRAVFSRAHREESGKVDLVFSFCLHFISFVRETIGLLETLTDGGGVLWCLPNASGHARHLFYWPNDQRNSPDASKHQSSGLARCLRLHLDLDAKNFLATPARTLR